MDKNSRLELQVCKHFHCVTFELNRAFDLQTTFPTRISLHNVTINISNDNSIERGGHNVTINGHLN